MTLRPLWMIAGLLLAGCSVLPTTDAPTQYRLPATTAGPAADAAPVDWSLRLDAPQAGRQLDSTRIAVLPQGDQFNAYAGARWTERAPVLLRDRLFDAFEADGRIGALSLDDNNLPTDFTLGGNLRAFQCEYHDGKPVVVIRFDAQLVRTASRRMVATHRFELRVPAAGTAVPQVVRAFGEAGDRLAAALIPWTVAAARQAAARSGGTSD